MTDLPPAESSCITLRTMACYLFKKKKKKRLNGICLPHHQASHFLTSFSLIDKHTRGILVHLTEWFLVLRRWKPPNLN